MQKYRSIRNVDWTKIPKVRGKVMEKGSHEVDTPDGKEARDFMVVDDGETLRRVYKAADLADCFKAASIGDMVSIEFVETVQLKKSGRKLNRFESSVWTEATPV
jgi:hypothetical protein